MEQMIKKIPENDERVEFKDQLDAQIIKTRQLCASFHVDSFKCHQQERHGVISI